MTLPSGREFELDEEGQVVGRDVRVGEAGDFVLLQPGHVERTEDPHDGHPRLGVEDVVQDAFEVEPTMRWSVSSGKTIKSATHEKLVKGMEPSA